MGSKRVDLELREKLASVAVRVTTLVLLKGCLLVLPIYGSSNHVTWRESLCLMLSTTVELLRFGETMRFRDLRAPWIEP